MKKQLLNRTIIKWVFLWGVIIAVPFLIDALYGCGVLGKIYTNSFKAEVWFSFLGSYLPGTVIGVLTIYQQHVIREKDRQYQELLERYLYVPNQGAKVYRYSKNTHMIGRWSRAEIISVTGSNEQDIFKEWMKGYILESSFHNVGNIGINDIRCSSVEWSIKDKTYIVKDKSKIKAFYESVGEARYKVWIYWMFDDEDDESADNVAACMNNYSRKDPDYYTSFLIVKVKITNVAKKSTDLFMKFKMRCPDNANSFCLQSFDERYYPG